MATKEQMEATIKDYETKADAAVAKGMGFMQRIKDSNFTLFILIIGAACGAAALVVVISRMN